MNERNEQFLTKSLANFIVLGTEKWEKGAIEHKDSIYSFTPKQVIKEIKGEIVDLWHYVEMLEQKLDEDSEK